MALKGKTMRVSGRGLKFALAIGAVILANGVAHAQPQTFASFAINDPTNNPVRMINDGTSASRFGTYTSGGTLQTLFATFRYTIPNGLAPANTDIRARVTISSAVNGFVQVGGGQTQQDFRDIRIVFTVDDPLYNALHFGENLLTVSTPAETGATPLNPGSLDPNVNGTNGTTGTMAGSTGGVTANLGASEVAGDEINFVGYSSNFLNFNQNFDVRSFQLGLSAIVPVTPPSPPTYPGGYRRGPAAAGNPNSTQYLRSFGATLTGSFDSDPLPLIPEPASIAFFLPVAAFAGWGIRKRLR